MQAPFVVTILCIKLTNQLPFVSQQLLQLFAPSLLTLDLWFYSVKFNPQLGTIIEKKEMYCHLTTLQ